MTPAGIEPAAFRFLVQHLNHCAIAVPNKISRLRQSRRIRLPQDDVAVSKRVAVHTIPKVLLIYMYVYTVCPTRYRTRHFFNNFTTNEDITP